MPWSNVGPDLGSNCAIDRKYHQEVDSRWKDYAKRSHQNLMFVVKPKFWFLSCVLRCLAASFQGGDWARMVGGAEESLGRVAGEWDTEGGSGVEVPLVGGSRQAARGLRRKPLFSL
jgi:hypothetical protein